MRLKRRYFEVGFFFSILTNTIPICSEFRVRSEPSPVCERILTPGKQLVSDTSNNVDSGSRVVERRVSSRFGSSTSSRMSICFGQTNKNTYFTQHLLHCQQKKNKVRRNKGWVLAGTIKYPKKLSVEFMVISEVSRQLGRERGWQRRCWHFRGAQGVLFPSLMTIWGLKSPLTWDCNNYEAKRMSSGSKIFTCKSH